METDDINTVIETKVGEETQYTTYTIKKYADITKALNEKAPNEKDEVVLDNNNKPVPSDRILANKSVGKRALVMAAGGIMNMILALVCFYVFLAANGGFSAPHRTNDVAIVNTQEEQSI